MGSNGQRKSMYKDNTSKRYDQDMIRNAIEVVKSRIFYESLGLGCKKASSTEYHDPCLWCGGKDRFHWNFAGSRQGKGACRQCGTSCDIIDIYKKKNGIDNIIEVIKRVAPEALKKTHKGTWEQPAPKQEPGPGPENDQALNKIKEHWENRCSIQGPGLIKRLLCDRRKIDLKTVELLIKTGRVKSCNHGGVMSAAFSFLSLQGEVQAIQFLTVNEQPFPSTTKNDNSDPAKRVFLGGSKPGGDCFFFAGQAIDQAEGNLFMLEGVVNAITMAQFYPNDCIIALGGSTLTKKLEALKPYVNRFENIICCGDNDEAVQKLNHIIRVALGGESQ